MAVMDYMSFDTHDTFDRLRFGVDDVSTSSMGRIAIVGLAGVGKKTLCNSLWGWEAVKPSEETTRNFGLITIIDLPLDPYDMTSVLYRLESIDLVIFVLDAEQGLDPDSFNWVARLRGLNNAMLIVLNKAEHLADDMLSERITGLETQLARPVIALQTDQQQTIRENLLSAVLKICPELATPLAMEITSLRRSVAQNLILQSIMTGLSLSFEGHSRHRHIDYRTVGGQGGYVPHPEDASQGTYRRDTGVVCGKPLLRRHHGLCHYRGVGAAWRAHGVIRRRTRCRRSGGRPGPAGLPVELRRGSPDDYLQTLQGRGLYRGRGRRWSRRGDWNLHDGAQIARQ